MANAFESAIKASAIKSLPNFDLVYREVVCQQGIADFVGLTSAASVFLNNNLEELSSTDSSSQILSLLKLNSGRKIKFLSGRIGITDATLNRVLKELISKNYVVKKNELYYLSKSYNLDKTNIWAFELKLSNWKRALFQALQYKAFANYSVVVFPLAKEKLIKENLDPFQKLNIGVLLFNPETLESKWISRAKKEHSISRWHTVFLLGQISNQFSHEHNISTLLPK